MGWVVIEQWVCTGISPCARCASLSGREFVQGKGPMPVRDTHFGCQCNRHPVRQEWRGASYELRETNVQSLDTSGSRGRSC
jgi:hypothetical protein